MPNLVTVNKELGIIEVKAYGVLLKSEMEEAIAEICRIRQEEGINKILADATKVEKGPDTTETYFIWSEYPSGFRQAVLLRRSDPAGSDAKYIENLCLNRGLLTRVFETREDALQWLLGE